MNAWRVSQSARDLAAEAVASDEFVLLRDSASQSIGTSNELHRVLDVMTRVGESDPIGAMSANTRAVLGMAMVLTEAACVCLTLASVLETEGVELELITPAGLLDLSLLLCVRL
jgi:hypothetical protein